VQEGISKVRQAEAELFPGYEKDDHPTKKLQQGVIQALPESLRESPLAGLLAKVSASNALLAAEVTHLKTELAKKTGIAADAAAAQPKKGAFANGASNRGVTDLSAWDRERQAARGN
jgi:hypothetical protein